MSLVEIIQVRLASWIFKLTEAEYCQRYSSSSYDQEIKEAVASLRELAEIIRLSGISDDLPDVMTGYLGIKYDLKYHKIK